MEKESELLLKCNVLFSINARERKRDREREWRFSTRNLIFLVNLSFSLSVYIMFAFTHR